MLRDDPQDSIADDPQDSIADEMRSIVRAFQNGQGEPTAGFAQRLTTASGVRYFGVHRNAQRSIDGNVRSAIVRHGRLKKAIVASMRLPSGTRAVQVIGDSVPYSSAGTSKATAFLERALTGPDDPLILYGYTGHATTDGTGCVNAVTSRVIRSSDSLMSRAVGNLVAFHTGEALARWGCSGPHLRCYVIVYGDDETSEETGTLFGDDIVTSDCIADAFILLEGGIQSFGQVCNALLLGKPVAALGDLRPPSAIGPCFGAVDFLLFVRAKLETSSGFVTPCDAEAADVEAWRAEYFDTHLLADPTRPDYETKQALWNRSWLLFVRERLYQRLHLVTFHDQ